MLSVAHHQDVTNYLPSAVAENPYWSDFHSFDWHTNLSGQHLYPDLPCPSWTPHDNALGLSNMYGFEFPTEQIPVSTMVASSSFSNPFSHQPPTFNDPFHHEVSSISALHNQCSYEESAFINAQETRAPRLDHAVSPHESSIIFQRPTSRSRRDRRGATRLLGASTVDSRYSPYQLDMPKRDTSTSTPTHHCHWNDDGYLCGAVVVGTKASIWRHLHEVHAIQLNTDKTMQTCMWETCGKSMRRESIARHILTVHFHDKVECPSCRTHFARRDSLQRHQRSCGQREEAPSQDAFPQVTAPVE